MEEEHPLGRRAPGHCARAAPQLDNMYRGVTISVKALTGSDFGRCGALALAIVFLAGGGGFTVTFEADGGSQVPADLPLRRAGRRRGPVKEDISLTAGDWDVEREHRPRDFARDTVEDSMYLYARWQPVP